MALVSLNWNNGHVQDSYRFRVTVKKEKYGKCHLFDHFTYTISKIPQRPSKVDLVEFVTYQGYQQHTVFTYHSYKYDIEQVELFINSYKPNIPLILIAIFNGGKIKKSYEITGKTHIIYDKGDRSEFEDLKSVLINANKNVNKELRLKNGGGSNDNINESVVEIYTIDRKSKFSKVTYTSNSDNLTSGDTSRTHSLYFNNVFGNQPDHDRSRLDVFKNNSYHAIVAYFSKQSGSRNQEKIPLWVQFISLLKVEQFKIKKSTLFGSIQWEDDSNTYESDEKLINQLLLLQEQFCTIPVFLDKIDSYDFQSVQPITAVSNSSLLQLKSIEVVPRFQSLDVSSNYNFIEHNLTPDFRPLINNLTVKGQALNKLENMGDFITLSQIEDKIKKCQDTEVEFILHSLQTFINLEIKLYISHVEIPSYQSNQLFKSPIFYQNSAKVLYVYFYSGSRSTVNVPLIMRYNNKYYGPNNKSDFFKKWVTLNISPAGDTIQQLKNNLDRINKFLNEIDLSEINGNSIYGLTRPQKSQGIPESFYNRVSVQKIDNGHYKMVSHLTMNKYQIGDIKFNKQTIRGITSSDITSDVNQVCAYYSLSDDRLKYPLLISLGSQSESRSNKWYSRSDLPGNTWSKHGSSNDYDSDNKINKAILKLKQKFFNPLVVQIEKQQTYPVTFSTNETESASQRQQNITIDSHGPCSSNPVSQYICIRQNLQEYYSQNIENIKTNLGLRSTDQFDKIDFDLIPEILTIPLKLNVRSTTKLCLVYVKNVDDLVVYFSNNKSQKDKVPLMFSYNRKWYIPVSKVNYFREWQEVEGINDFTNTSSIKSQLDTVNKMLNEVDICNTNKDGYGIPELQDQSVRELKQFCKRINVKLLKGACYRKVIHSTLNNCNIGNIYFNGTSINISELNSVETIYNIVSVYYLSNDTFYRTPLLLNIASDSSTFNSHWFRRTTYRTGWEKCDNNQFSNDSNIKLELLKLSINNEWKLHIQLDDNRSEYQIDASYGDYGIIKHRSSISPNLIGTFDGIKLDEYRYYGHGLSGYYEKNESKILKLHSTGPNLTLDLIMNISKNRIQLVDLNDHIISLKYTNEDFMRKRDIDVYFNKNDEDPHDIPMLFKYGDRFFAPKDKDSYFTRWSEISELKGITGPDPSQGKKDQLKSKLDDILNMFNEIDITKTTDYGIPYFDQPYYFKKGLFSTKRVHVKTYNHSKYKVRVHTTLKKNVIGNIKNNDRYKFIDHYDIDKQNINQLFIVYTMGDLSDFNLILLNFNGEYYLSTYGYYYKDSSHRSRPKTLMFQKLKSSSDLISISEDKIQIFIQTDNELSHIKETLLHLSTSQINFDKAMSKSDSDTTDKQETDVGEAVRQECDEKIEPPPLKGSTESFPPSTPSRTSFQTSLHSGVPDGPDLLTVKSQQSVSIETPGISELSRDSLIPPLTFSKPLAGQLLEKGNLPQDFGDDSLTETTVTRRDDSSTRLPEEEFGSFRGLHTSERAKSDSESQSPTSKTALQETLVHEVPITQGHTSYQENPIIKPNVEENRARVSELQATNFVHEPHNSGSSLNQNSHSGSISSPFSEMPSSTGMSRQTSDTNSDDGLANFLKILNDYKIYIGASGGGIVTASVGSLIIYKLVKKSKK